MATFYYIAHIFLTLFIFAVLIEVRCFLSQNTHRNKLYRPHYSFIKINWLEGKIEIYDFKKRKNRSKPFSMKKNARNDTIWNLTLLPKLLRSLVCLLFILCQKQMGYSMVTNIRRPWTLAIHGTRVLCRLWSTLLLKFVPLIRLKAKRILLNTVLMIDRGISLVDRHFICWSMVLKVFQSESV